MRTSITTAIFVFIFAAFCSPLAAQNNPVPFVNSPLVPGAALPGGSAFTLTVNGAGFVSGAVVKWNGSARATTFVTSTRVTAAILATDLTVPATVFVTVTNPNPGGGVSNPVYFQVTTPVTSLSFTRTDTSFPQHGIPYIIAPQGIVTGNFANDATPFMAIANGQCSQLFGGPGCLPPDAYIEVVKSGSVGGPLYAFTGEGIATGDFNGDGILDLVSAYPDGISVELGRGDGSFQQEQDFTSPFSPSVAQINSPLVIGDFNRDGHLDVVYLGAFGTSGVYFLPGTASGLFGTPVLLSRGDYSAGGQVVSGDFNGDGKLDFAVTTLYVNSVSIFLGNGDGTFQPPVNYPTGSSPWTIVVADFNADGKPDLAVLNESSMLNAPMVSIFLGNGDGTFKAKVDYLAGISPSGIAFGDYNGDGIEDLAVTDSWQCTNVCAAGSVNVLLGNGDGSFQSPLGFATSSGYGAGAIASGEFVDPSIQVGRLGFIAGSGFNLVSIFTPNPTGSRTPMPKINSISPPSIVAASLGFPLTVNGTNFVAGSTVYFGGVPETTTFVSATQLTASIPASAIAVAGTPLVAVAIPGGSPWLGATFTINNPIPAVTSISPLSVPAGNSAFSLTIAGANLVPASQVLVNNSARVTTFVNSTSLSAALLATDVAQGGNLSVTVTNPTPGGGLTAPISLIVTDYAVSAVNASASVSAGQPASFSLTVAPSNGAFTNPVTFNASGLPAGTMASFSPSTPITPGSASVNVMLSITTTPHNSASLKNSPRWPGRGWPSWYLIVAAFGMIGFALRISTTRARRFAPRYLLVLLLVSAAAIVACTSGGNPPTHQVNPATGTPAGTYPILVTATSGGVAHTTTVTLTVI